MSIPLPHLPLKSSSNFFLDPDERYEVYVVKVAERPNLLCVESSDDEVANSDIATAPLIVGCDVPGWRKSHLVPISPDLEGCLRIGSGSLLFRRRRQWPAVSTWTNSTPWNALRERLLIPPPSQADVHRVDAREMAALADGRTRFATEWERRNAPVLLEHCTQGWPAMPIYSAENDANFWNGGGKGGWTMENLLKRFGDVSWRLSDTHGEMLSLATYGKYIVNPEGQTDDSPLAIYDSEFGDDAPTNVLTSEYTVPACFSPDLFSLAKGKRPPYRWILIGPARSGTGLHIDPLYTNAWVTLLQGRKRWLLFPPETPPELIGMGAVQIPSSIWFSRYYDKVMEPSFPFSPVHVLQQPGETVFVPATCPHLVLNLDLTVAITHNYASEFAPCAWPEVVLEEPEFAADWYKGLQSHRPDLAEHIRQSYPDTVPSLSTS